MLINISRSRRPRPDQRRRHAFTFAAGARSPCRRRAFAFAFTLVQISNPSKGLHWKGKVWSIARYRLYPASRVSGRGPAGLGKPKLLLRVVSQRLLASDAARATVLDSLLCHMQHVHKFTLYLRRLSICFEWHNEQAAISSQCCSDAVGPGYPASHCIPALQKKE